MISNICLQVKNNGPILSKRLIILNVNQAKEAIMNIKDRQIILCYLRNMVNSEYEPEDMDFYKGKALLFCGQEGGIYQINKL